MRANERMRHQDDRAGFPLWLLGVPLPLFLVLYLLFH